MAVTGSASSSTLTLHPTSGLPNASTCAVSVPANRWRHGRHHARDPAADGSWSFSTETPPAQSLTPVVISQVYGGGGNANATYRNDFVELYNRSTSPVNITGWSVQYAGDRRSGATGSQDDAGGHDRAGEYYLVALASGGERRYGIAGGERRRRDQHERDDR